MASVQKPKSTLVHISFNRNRRKSRQIIHETNRFCVPSVMTLIICSFILNGKVEKVTLFLVCKKLFIHLQNMAKVISLFVWYEPKKDLRIWRWIWDQRVQLKRERTHISCKGSWCTTITHAIFRREDPNITRNLACQRSRLTFYPRVRHDIVA